MKRISSKNLVHKHYKEQVKNKPLSLTLTDKDKKLSELHKTLKLQIELVPSKSTPY